MNDLIQKSAKQLAQLIAAGEVASVDAVEARIARIEQVNPRLNAVVVKRYEAARIEAKAADARRARGEMLPALHGVPITVKECLDLTGTPSTFGIPARANHSATADEIHVARLRAAGAIVVGKTNVSQCLFYTEADNPLHGRCNNPWNLERTPGGSSGGEAAIIAAGGSPMGLGTDIGGSVRTPAAFCGIASLKPTSGRMDDLGEFSVPPGQRAVPSQVGVMARKVEDVALGYSIAAQAELHRISVEGLRIGWYDEDESFATAPAVKRAVAQAAQVLRDAGATLVPWTPPEVREAYKIFAGIMTGDGGAHMKRITAGGPRTPQLKQLLIGASMPVGMARALRKLMRALGQNTLADGLDSFGPPTAERYWQLVVRQSAYQKLFAERLDHAEGGRIDLLLAPAASLPAFTHGATRDILTAGAYAPLYNFVGYPAGVVPVTRVRAGEESLRPESRDLVLKLARRIEAGSAGLPVGVQVVGRPWCEDAVLGAMAVLEQGLAGLADFPAAPGNF